MENIIYNQFLNMIALTGLDLSELDSNGKSRYKLALLKVGSEESELNWTDPSYGYDFSTIQQYECLDTGGYADEKYGYKAGGLYIYFSSPIKDAERDCVDYLSPSKIYRERVTLTGENAARYAVIYRVSDGLLISAFDLGRNLVINDDTLSIGWGEIAVIRIYSVSGGGGDIDIDDSLSKESPNAVRNKGITESMTNYGVAIGGEEISAALEGVDTLNRLDDNDIESIFEGN